MQLLKTAAESAKCGNYDDAIAQLKQLLDEDRNNELAIGMLAAIYLQIGMHQRASSWYRKLRELSPDNPLARFQLGLTRLNQGMPGEALESWQPLLEKEGEFVAHFHSALALLQLDRREDAHQLLELAGQRMPTDHPLQPALTRLLAESGHSHAEALDL
jgi:tetratricopeptide (TPR) repeat protein